MTNDFESLAENLYSAVAACENKLPGPDAFNDIKEQKNKALAAANAKQKNELETYWHDYVSKLELERIKEIDTATATRERCASEIEKWTQKRQPVSDYLSSGVEKTLSAKKKSSQNMAFMKILLPVLGVWTLAFFFFIGPMFLNTFGMMMVYGLSLLICLIVSSAYKMIIWSSYNRLNIKVNEAYDNLSIIDTTINALHKQDKAAQEKLEALKTSFEE